MLVISQQVLALATKLIESSEGIPEHTYHNVFHLIPTYYSFCCASNIMTAFSTTPSAAPILHSLMQHSTTTVGQSVATFAYPVCVSISTALWLGSYFKL